MNTGIKYILFIMITFLSNLSFSDNDKIDILRKEVLDIPLKSDTVSITMSVNATYYKPLKSTDGHYPSTINKEQLDRWLVSQQGVRSQIYTRILTLRENKFIYERLASPGDIFAVTNHMIFHADFDKLMTATKIVGSNQKPYKLKLENNLESIEMFKNIFDEMLYPNIVFGVDISSQFQNNNNIDIQYSDIAVNLSEKKILYKNNGNILGIFRLSNMSGKLDWACYYSTIQKVREIEFQGYNTNKYDYYMPGKIICNNYVFTTLADRNAESLYSTYEITIDDFKINSVTEEYWDLINE